MRLLRILVVTVLTVMLSLPGGNANADDEVSTYGNPDVSADDFSPLAWNEIWQPTFAIMGGIKTAPTETFLTTTGMATSEQISAMSEEDLDVLTGAKLGSLLDAVSNWVGDQKDEAFAEPPIISPWSIDRSDEVAAFLGGSNYAELSPGLKSVVQRIARIVTGDYKPPMPDDQWRTWMSPATSAAFDAHADSHFDWAAGKVAVAQNRLDFACALQALTFSCEAAQVIAGAIDFFMDPFGWIAQKTGDAASSLMGWLAQQANDATQVDLTLTWWLNGYMLGFAVGIILMLGILMWQFFQRARGKIGNEDLIESVTFWAPAYIAGVVFGPALGQFMIKGSGYLANDVIQAVFGTTVSESADTISVAAIAAGAGTILGGVILAILLLIVVLVAGVFVFISLAAQSAAIYMSSVVFGIAFAWVVAIRHRGGSMKIPYLFLGVVFSRPLLFLLLGVGMGLTREGLEGNSDSGLRNLAILIMAIVVLSMAAFSPLLLLQFAPVAPTGMQAATAAGGAVSDSNRHRSGGLSKLGEMARSRGGGSSQSGGPGSVAGGGHVGPSAGGAGSGPLGGAGNSPQSSSSAAARSRGSNTPSTLTGQLLGRTRRHGGSRPSAGAGNIAAASKGKASGVKNVARGAAGIGSGVAASGRRVGAASAQGVGGDQPW